MTAFSTPPDPPQSQTLIAILSDPRQSHLPAEAVRIATGVSVWQKTEIYLYLGSSMLEALHDPHNLVDGDLISQYQSDLLAAIKQLLIPAEAVDLLPFDFRQCPWAPVSRAELADRMSRCSRVLRY